MQAWTPPPPTSRCTTSASTSCWRAPWASAASAPRRGRWFPTRTRRTLHGSTASVKTLARPPVQASRRAFLARLEQLLRSADCPDSVHQRPDDAAQQRAVERQLAGGGSRGCPATSDSLDATSPPADAPLPGAGNAALACGTQRRTRVLVVVDDNMQYRSMRYRCFQLARRHRAAYMQLYVRCPLQVSRPERPCGPLQPGAGL